MILSQTYRYHRLSTSRSISGGVGPMTVALLLKNTVENAKRLLITTSTRASWNLTPLTLTLETPVPADIVIASGQKPKPIRVVAEEVGLVNEEVDLYGKNKAKVGLQVLDRLAGNHRFREIGFLLLQV